LGHVDIKILIKAAASNNICKSIPATTDKTMPLSAI